jgi:hypothetical protein
MFPVNCEITYSLYSLMACLFLCYQTCTERMGYVAQNIQSLTTVILTLQLVNFLGFII